MGVFIIGEVSTETSKEAKESQGIIPSAEQTQNPLEDKGGI